MKIRKNFYYFVLFVANSKAYFSPKKICFFSTLPPYISLLFIFWLDFILSINAPTFIFFFLFFFIYFNFFSVLFKLEKINKELYIFYLYSSHTKIDRHFLIVAIYQNYFLSLLQLSPINNQNVTLQKIK
jgi:hypothetical protein